MSYHVVEGARPHGVQGEPATWFVVPVTGMKQGRAFSPTVSRGVKDGRALSPILSLLLLLACDPRPEIQAQISALKTEQALAEASTAATRTDLTRVAHELAAAQADVERLRTEARSIAACSEGRRYILMLSLRQVHYTLNVRRQIADAVNKEKFELFVDRLTFDNAVVGEDLFSAFKTGSALLYRSMGKWEIKIEDKRIEGETSK